MARPRTQDIVPAVAGGWVVTVAWQLSQASVTSTARYRCSALLCSTVLYCALLCSTVLYSGDNGAPWAAVCTPHCTDWLEKSSGRITTLASSQETWCSVAVCCVCVSTSNNTAPTAIPLCGPQDGGEVAGDAVHLLLLLHRGHRGHRGLAARDEVQPRAGGGHGCGGGSSIRQLEVGPANVLIRVCKTSYILYLLEDVTYESLL